MRYSVHNYAEESYVVLTDGAGAALTADTGYDADDLVDGMVESAWRSAGSAATHDIVLDFGAVGPEVDPLLVALFDVEGVAGGVVTSIAVHYSAVSNVGPWTSLGSLTLQSRGGAKDGALCVANPSTLEWLRIRVTVAGLGSKIDIGHIHVGTYVDPSVVYSRREDDRQHNVVSNESPGRTVWATQLGAEIRTFSLGWDRLLSTPHDELLDLLEATGGMLRPLVLIPDTSDIGGVYHGRIGNSLPHRVDLPLYDGHAIVFTESGRAF